MSGISVSRLSVLHRSSGCKIAVWIAVVSIVSTAFVFSQEANTATGEVARSVGETATISVLEANTEIRSQSFGNIIIPCGTVDQGQAIKVLLTVKNAMDEPFHFDAAAPSCSCTFFDTSAKSIAPGEAIVMEFRFKSNLDPIAREHRASVKLLRNSQEIGLLIPACKIRFGLSFEKGNHSILLGGPVAEYRIPFFYSDPIQINDLQVSIASGFEQTDLGFLIKPVADGHGYVAILTKDVGNDRGFDSGILRLEHKLSGRHADTTVLASRKAPVEITPNSLFFARVDESSDTGLYAASALLRINSISTLQGRSEGSGVQLAPPSLKRDDDYVAQTEVDREEIEAERLRHQDEVAKDPEYARRQQEARERINVGGFFDVQGEPRVEVKQIGKTVVRIRVFAQRAQLDENKSIQWVVSRDGVSHAFTSTFSIEE